MHKKSIFDYKSVVDEGEIEGLINLSSPLKGKKIQHINSTKKGGGVAEILNNLVPMLNELGMENIWSDIKGDQRFFEITKKIHNSLHGSGDKLNADDYAYFEKNVLAQKDTLIKDADVYVVHDPQPLPLVKFRKEFGGKWIWRCHIDLSTSTEATWKSLEKYVSMFDAAIFHCPGYAKELKIRQFIFPPTIDPLAAKNVDMSQDRIDGVRKKYGIAGDKKIIVQIGRFDRLKDPFGAIEAYRIVNKMYSSVLVLAGSYADDDPEGEEIYKEVLAAADGDSDIKVLNIPTTDESPFEINAFQRMADVCLQMSSREGFGLTVAEALWKGTPVVARDSSGIALQILHGINGFLVKTPQGAAYRISQIFSSRQMREKFAEAASAYVYTHFLLPKHLKNWICCLNAALMNKAKGIVEI
ncbi:MAG: glycosyltransferase [Elusimicrobiota bacterium]|nr:glycosyltransferase [Elusimicrobiota bacterium]